MQMFQLLAQLIEQIKLCSCTSEYVPVILVIHTIQKVCIVFLFFFSIVVHSSYTLSPFFANFMDVFMTDFIFLCICFVSMTVCVCVCVCVSVSE